MRVVFITKKTSAKVTGDAGPQVMTYPHLLIREAIAFMVLVIALVGVALFWDAPLEQLANPLLTPNPAKAPWYFLGLQELLHYFPPLVAGIIIPTLVVVALVIVPYFNVNIQGAPLWSGNRKRTLWIFLAVMVALTCLLALFRAWTVLVPTEIIALLALGSYRSTPSPNRGAVSWWRRERAAFLVGDDLVHLRRGRPDCGWHVFPRSWMVVGLAVELPCRLSRWGRFRGAYAWPLP